MRLSVTVGLLVFWFRWRVVVVAQQGYDLASQHDLVAMVEVKIESLPSILHAGIIVKVGWRGSINRVYLFT